MNISRGGRHEVVLLSGIKGRTSKLGALSRS